MRHRLQRILELGATVAADLISLATDCKYPTECLVTATEDVICDSSDKVGHDVLPGIGYHRLGSFTQPVNGTLVGSTNSWTGPFGPLALRNG